jgi:hypothetical protein
MEKEYIYLDEILDNELIDLNIKQFFSAEVDWWLYEERIQRETSKNFDYTDSYVIDTFLEIDKILKTRARFTYGDSKKMIANAVKSRFNYLIRPRVTLSWFIFKGEPTKSVEEILLKLNYFSDYIYITNPIVEELIEDFKSTKKKLFSRMEFEKLVKITDDSYVYSISPDDFINTLDPLFEIFNPSDNPEIEFTLPLDALLIFLDDKGLIPVLKGLQLYSTENNIDEFTKKDLLNVLNDLVRHFEENPEYKKFQDEQEFIEYPILEDNDNNFKTSTVDFEQEIIETDLKDFNESSINNQLNEIQIEALTDKLDNITEDLINSEELNDDENSHEIENIVETELSEIEEDNVEEDLDLDLSDLNLETISDLDDFEEVELTDSEDLSELNENIEENLANTNLEQNFEDDIISDNNEENIIGDGLIDEIEIDDIAAFKELNEEDIEIEDLNLEPNIDSENFEEFDINSINESDDIIDLKDDQVNEEFIEIEIETNGESDKIEENISISDSKDILDLTDFFETDFNIDIEEIVESDLDIDNEVFKVNSELESIKKEVILEDAVDLNAPSQSISSYLDEIDLNDINNDLRLEEYSNEMIDTLSEINNLNNISNFPSSQPLMYTDLTELKDDDLVTGMHNLESDNEDHILGLDEQLLDENFGFNNEGGEYIHLDESLSSDFMNDELMINLKFEVEEDDTNYFTKKPIDLRESHYFNEITLIEDIQNASFEYKPVTMDSFITNTQKENFIFNIFLLNDTAYRKTLEIMDTCDYADQAIGYLENYLNSNKIEAESDIKEEFINCIKKRFE